MIGVAKGFMNEGSKVDAFELVQIYIIFICTLHWDQSAYKYDLFIRAESFIDYIFMLYFHINMIYIMYLGNFEDTSWFVN